MADTSKPVGSMRFGPYELSLEHEELRKAGNRLKLTGQAIQVLLVLANNPGKLVTREELQQKLWPGATYGDFEHGLNAAVNRLRETLGDSATDPKYIETIPRRGYRFIAAPDPTTVKTPWWKRKTTIAVAASVVVVGSLYPWLRPRVERLVRVYELQQLTVLPLTALPGNAGSPTFSPDGSQVAFVWDGGNAAGSDLFVKVIGSDKPLRVTYHGRAAWSPDGRSIALWHNAPADACGLYLIAPLGGPERRIASASCLLPTVPLISWSPDGKQLAFLDTAKSPSTYTIGLFVLSLDSLEKTMVKTDCNLVQTPAFSPRGDYLAWGCAEDRSKVSLHLQRLSDGNVTQLLQDVDGVEGLAWSRDGRRIVFSTANGGDLWEVALARPNHPVKLPIGHDASSIALVRLGLLSCKAEGV